MTIINKKRNRQNVYLYYHFLLYIISFFNWYRIYSSCFVVPSIFINLAEINTIIFPHSFKTLLLILFNYEFSSISIIWRHSQYVKQFSPICLILDEIEKHSIYELRNAFFSIIWSFEFDEISTCLRFEAVNHWIQN